MNAKREERTAVQCFTCPRERRADEPGWHYVEVPERARSYGPSRMFVCPRHYRHFAEQERGRWTELDAPPVETPPIEVPVLVAAAASTTQWSDANHTLDAGAASAEPAIAALSLIDSLASNS